MGRLNTVNTCRVCGCEFNPWSDRKHAAKAEVEDGGVCEAGEHEHDCPFEDRPCVCHWCQVIDEFRSAVSSLGEVTNSVAAKAIAVELWRAGGVIFDDEGYESTMRAMPLVIQSHLDTLTQQHAAEVAELRASRDCAIEQIGILQQQLAKAEAGIVVMDCTKDVVESCTCYACTTDKLAKAEAVIEAAHRWKFDSTDRRGMALINALADYER